MKPKKKIETLDDLAAVIQRTMASKEDLEGLATKEDIANLDNRVSNLDNRLTNRISEVDEHVRDLAQDISKIDRKLEGVPSLAEFDELRKRLERVEKKVGLV